MPKNRILKKSKKKEPSDNVSGKLHIVWRIAICFYIAILLYFQFTCGGNGADWVGAEFL